MTVTCDYLMIGGGIAGLSAAARLAGHGRTIVIEGEEAIGYHSSGRSVATSHYGIGNEVVRGLTGWSRTFFERQPEGFSDTAVGWPIPTLYFAHRESEARLDSLGAEMARFTDAVHQVGPEEMMRLCPVLRTGEGGAVRGLLDPTGLKLDADAMLQGFARALRRAGGELLTGRRIVRIGRSGEAWTATSESGESWSAPILIDAAGAWADRIAALVGIRPLGLQPKRRTIIVVDPPAGADSAAWPFVHSAAGDFYMLPEAGQILASPVDEVDDEPGDAQPEDYDIALAADRVEYYTTLKVDRIAHRWAGLRSFVADRTPTAGFADDAPGFFWLLGQGGYGLQTAPAMAAIVEALVAGSPWPSGLEAAGVTAESVAPSRLQNNSAQPVES
jgi:D-arginine dehydrogenase